MQDDLYKFELETMADEFSEGNWSNVFNRTVINLAQTMPALFQSMTPVVGLAKFICNNSSKPLTQKLKEMKTIVI